MSASEALDITSLLKTIPIQKHSQSGKLMARWRLDRKVSHLRNLRCAYIQKRFYLFTWHFLSLHTFFGKKQSHQLYREIRNLTHVFPDESNSISAVECMWLLVLKNIKLAHIAGSMNTAADFFSRLDLKVTEKIPLKIREDIITTPIEVTTSSSEVTDEEQFFFTKADNENESGEQTLKPEKQSRQHAKQCVANEEPLSLNTSVKEFTKVDGNTTSYSMDGITANARIRVEEDVDLVLKNLQLKILGQPHDEVLLMTDPRHNLYKANEDRIILKGDLLLRKIFGENCSVKYYQILIPKQLANEVLWCLHEEFHKNHDIPKQKLLSRKTFNTEKRCISLGNASCHANNASENHELMKPHPHSHKKS